MAAASLKGRECAASSLEMSTFARDTCSVLVKADRGRLKRRTLHLRPSVMRSPTRNGCSERTAADTTCQ